MRFFFAHPVLPSVHARSARVGIGERESRRAWGQQLVVRGKLHLPTGKLVMRVARVAPKRARCFNSKGTSFHVVLELEHVKPVDQRSAIRKADAVLPAFARAGQRHDTLKRVAQRGRCRLLFLVGVKHVFVGKCCAHISAPPPSYFAHSSPHGAISKASPTRTGRSSPGEDIWLPSQPAARL